MPPLKILHLSSERSWRGGEQQIAYLLESLVAQGVQVKVLARKASAFAKWCHERGIDCIEAPFTNAFDLQTVWAIKRAAQWWQPDIIHCHSGKAHSLVYLATLLGVNKPVVVHRRVDFALSNSVIKRAKYEHPSVKRIICVSEAIAGIVKPSLKHPRKICTVHSGIDFDRFPQTGKSGYLHQTFKIASAKKLVGMVAALAPHKDYGTFISAAAKVLVHRDDVHFFAIGSGQLDVELKQLVESLGIGSAFTFTGFRNDVANILQELDIFVLTSRTEGLGTSLIDAMYNALPVVASRAGGIPELVEHQVTGLLCAVGGVEGFAESINQLLDNDSLSKKYGLEGKARSMKFSRNTMAEEILKLYREVLEEQ
jgi:glycosyltransferase involved in cell wall biosynthesis